ncbi:MAG: hypothetical protein QF828_10155, partial [Pseudomonadales bacterium]|nr:hypothetical protein [Pseudomonadales bacterium]
HSPGNFCAPVQPTTMSGIGDHFEGEIQVQLRNMNLDEVEADEVEADEGEAEPAEETEIPDGSNWQFQWLDQQTPAVYAQPAGDEMAVDAEPAGEEIPDVPCLGRCGYYAHTRPHWLRSSHGWDLNGWCCGSCHLVTCQLEGYQGPPVKEHWPYWQLRAIAEIEAGDDAQTAVDEMAGEAQPVADVQPEVDVQPAVDAQPAVDEIPEAQPAGERHPAFLVVRDRRHAGTHAVINWWEIPCDRRRCRGVRCHFNHNVPPHHMLRVGSASSREAAPEIARRFKTQMMNRRANGDAEWEMCLEISSNPMGIIAGLVRVISNAALPAP